MTLTSLLIFAGVYFAAVASPGPGVAALVARVLGQGLVGVAPFIAGYFVGDMIWLILAATGLAVIAKTFATLFVAIKFAGAAYLLFWRGGWRPRRLALEQRRLPPRAPVPGLAVADPRESQGDRLLPLHHAARRRREDTDGP